MGREVRKVAKDWAHPKGINEDYLPLLEEEMPNFRTPSHYQMYETCSEGTPISPVMASPEELAQWLFENRASAFAGQTASYEDWLSVCKGRIAVSGVIVGNKVISGVEYQNED